MFSSIWKEQIQKPKGGATIWQPKEKMKPDKRTNCKEKLRKIMKFWEEYEKDIRWNVPKPLHRHTNRVRKGLFLLQDKTDNIPEEVCCEFIDFINREFPLLTVPKMVTLTPKKFPRYTFLIKNNYDEQHLIRFGLFLDWYRGQHHSPSKGWDLGIYIRAYRENDIERRDLEAKDILAQLKKQFGE